MKKAIPLFIGAAISATFAMLLAPKELTQHGVECMSAALIAAFTVLLWMGVSALITKGQP